MEALEDSAAPPENQRSNHCLSTVPAGLTASVLAAPQAGG
jgi:hypothetical protein